MSGLQRKPTATYRLQFNSEFGFKDAGGLVSYLDHLGISDIYASPIFKARKGSSHGYDVTDPTRLNHELGTVDDFDSLAEDLQKQGMGLLLDIVPNHMAASPENPWWRNVMERGQESPFAGFFDTDWLDFSGSTGVTAGHRRFFDIGDFIGTRIEDRKVFEAVHSLVLHLISEGKVTGLRVDHIDGLYNPLEYLERLQHRISSLTENRGFYVLVEKILSSQEALPDAWPVSGTTGYDFINAINMLFTDSRGMNNLTHVYRRFTGSERTFHELVYEKKKQVMRELFHKEISALGYWLAYLSNNLSGAEASSAIEEVTACLPVYRTYINSMKLEDRDREYINSAVKEAFAYKSCPESALNFIHQVLLLDFLPGMDTEEKVDWLNFVMRWQQITGAIMAKGFEDTALYNYSCLTSLNEVGGTPDSTGLTIEDFHKLQLTRLEHWPDTLNATSTHDSKRSEDVRARISVLSEVPGEWEERLIHWQECNREKKEQPDGIPAPVPEDEMLLYQTLIGAWPLHEAEVPGFQVRLKDYMIKATREAKNIASWMKINQKYEDSLLSFIDSILEDSINNEFLADFLKFQKRIAYYGALNSLSQLLLKITSPGVPDFYQGTELWDFSLVDPDNRRPVEFGKRERLLELIILDGNTPPIGEMLTSWQDGRIKLFVTFKALNYRRDNSRLFQNGEYLPLRVGGKRQKSVCVFIRHLRDEWALVAVPRFYTKLSDMNIPPFGKQVWEDDSILLPGNMPGHWRNIFTGETVEARNTIALSYAFRTFPIALLTASV